MPLIPYYPENFNASYGQGFQHPNYLKVDWKDIIKASVTYKCHYRFAYHRYDRFPMHVRLANEHRLLSLLKGYEDCIVKSSDFINQESTEMASSAYFLGMIINKLLADKLLNVPWLVLLGTLRRAGLPMNFNNRSIGSNTLTWVHPNKKSVLEPKFFSFLCNINLYV